MLRGRCRKGGGVGIQPQVIIIKTNIYIYIYMREKEKTTSPADDAIRTKKGGGKEKVIKK